MSGDRDRRRGRDARGDRYRSPEGGDSSIGPHRRDGQPPSDERGDQGRYSRSRYHREDTEFDNNAYGAPSWSPQQQQSMGGYGDQQSMYGMPGNHDNHGGPGGGGPYMGSIFYPPPSQQQQQPFGDHYGMPYPNTDAIFPPSMGSAYNSTETRFNNPMPGPDSQHMNRTELLHILLQQQQQQSAFPYPVDSRVDPTVAGGQGPNTASRALPSVEDFIPVVPKSLLNLVCGGPAPADGDRHSSSPLPQTSHDGVPSSGGGALTLLEAPKVSPEADKRAREQRRMHITGFPEGTSSEELEDYFRVVLPEVRRLKTEREIRALAEESGLLKEEGEEAVRHVPPTANLSHIDTIRELTMSSGRSVPFSFIELRLADMVAELVEQCETDSQRFIFQSANDGRSYPLMIRRPRVAQPLTGVDDAKVVLIGFPLTMPAESIRSLFDSYGKLLAFEVANGYAYAEFADPRDVLDFRVDVHGVVLGNSVVIVLPLHNWLKVLLVREGLEIEVADDDPISGKYVMQQVRDRLVDASGRSKAGHDGAADGSTALVVPEDPEIAGLQLIRVLLDMSLSLPESLIRFSVLHKHLRPLFGSGQLTVYPTPVLVLLNLFDEEELVFDSSYSRLLADIEEEVEKYGRVRQLVVPRRAARPRLPEVPKPGIDYDEEDTEAEAAAMAAYNAAKQNFGSVLGKYLERQTHPVWGGYSRVFVEYETVDEAAAAQRQIAGKLFGDRTVITSFIYPDLLKEEEDKVEEEEEEDAVGSASDSEKEGQQPEVPEQQDSVADETAEDAADHAEDID